MQADIAYLTRLDEVISTIRNESWALVADLRGWRVSDDVINFKHNQTIQLARKNQQVECWLVDNPEQGNHIQHHIENAGVPLYKCTCEQNVSAHLRQYGFILHKE